MASFLVTGGAGFIGSHIADALVAEGHSVRVLDNFETGKLENLRQLGNKVEIVRGDVRDEVLMRESLKGIDYVYHEAALPSVKYSLSHPKVCNAASVDGTLNVLLAARAAGVKRVIYASSSALYGDSPELPKREDMWVLPSSPYGVAKYSAELYCRVFYNCYRLETVCLRYFNVFGPRQSPGSVYAGVMPIFISMLLAAKTPTIDGDGEQTRDFTFVDDVVRANLLALRGEKAVGQAVNVATGKPVSVNELYRMIDESLQTGIKPNYGPSRSGDIKHSVADISLARELLGYEPQVDFAEGLRKTIRWSRKHVS